MAQLCQMTIGFLIPRTCDNKAQFPCSKCGRWVCEEHAVILDSGVVCEACHLGFESAVPPGKMAERVTNYDITDAAVFIGASDHGFFDDFS